MLRLFTCPLPLNQAFLVLTAFLSAGGIKTLRIFLSSLSTLTLTGPFLNSIFAFRAKRFFLSRSLFFDGADRSPLLPLWPEPISELDERLLPSAGEG